MCVSFGRATVKYDPGPRGEFDAHISEYAGPGDPDYQGLTWQGPGARAGRPGPPEPSPAHPDRSPVWILRCTFRWWDVRKVFPQYGQSFMAAPRLLSRSSPGCWAPAGLPASSPTSAAGETFARHFSTCHKLFAPKLLTPHKVKHVSATPAYFIL